MNNMWGEPPSGREQAIETLIDMDPNGSFYRASRILEEAVPLDLLQRPNLITKSALVDQAYALSKYEVDTVEKYDVVFGTGGNSSGSSFRNQCFSNRLRRAELETRKNRILKHHSKILEAKKGRYQQNSSSLAPSPQLVAGLRQVYGSPEGETTTTTTTKGSEESSTLRSLLKSVMEHPAFCNKNDEKNDTTSSVSIPEKTETNPESDQEDDEKPLGAGSATYALESLIAFLGNKLEVDEACFSPSATIEHGLMIAVLSVLMGYHTFDDEEHRGEKVYSSDSDEKRRLANVGAATLPPLQVGALLSLFQVNNDSKKNNPWALDDELVAYLGEAAAVYEERIEIQTARLLKRMNRSKTNEASETLCGSDNGGIAQGDNRSIASANEGSTVMANQESGSSSNPVTPAPMTSSPLSGDLLPTTEAEAVDRQDLEATAAALSAAISEQIASATTGEESSEDREDVNHAEQSDDAEVLESDDDEFHDEDLPRDENGEGNVVLDDEEDEDDSDSSSSSSASGAEPEDGDENDDMEEEESEDDDDEDQFVNRGDDIGEHADSDDDEDMALRQALALSLVEQAEASQSDSSILVEEIDASSDPDGCPSNPVTPRSQTPLVEEEPEAVQEKLQESPLPALPPTPKINPFADELLMKNGEEYEQGQFDSALILDPSALNLFGTLPTPNVLMHLLDFLGDVMNRHVHERSDSEIENKTKDRFRTTAIPGGMGSHLFPPSHSFLDSKLKSESERDIAVSTQLLVALFLLSVERRNSALTGLKSALDLERKAAQDGGGKDSSAASTGEEGDDPAIAMALTYFDDDVSESKESLETKGMTRKAAAAAHDAAVLLESLHRKSNAWRNEVKMFSHCAMLAMRYLRQLFQGIVRSWLQERQGFSATDCQALLPASVKTKLVEAITSFATVSSEFHATLVIGGNEEEIQGQIESIFMSTTLYQDSMVLWGEIVPLVYPSVSQQTELLRELLIKCSNSKSSKMKHGSLSIHTHDDLDVNMYRLHILCRRLRVGDLLDRFVPSPACYVPGDNEADSPGEIVEIPSPNDSGNVSSIISLIGSMSTALDGLKGEVQSLYLSFCHRCHTRILLWDGAFACAESDADETMPSLTTAPADPLRLNLKMSNRLHFDATKCSDSMAILTNMENPSSALNSSSVHQRASKVWGTVLSSMCFSPKTGIHRWAIKLDKCERGHVFVGVATSQASTRTYVGGDKFGWGMIGTQALWHDRRKIRGDYGDTFRTGTSIIVTLDTDAGTLSYSALKDSSSSSLYSIDQVAQNIASPRRYGQTGGNLEDWGVAFEGLPLDSKLYPAVGLYQRDDRVTILAVEASKEGRIGSTGLSVGLSYYPPLYHPPETDKLLIERMKLTRKFNDSLQMDGMLYAAKALDCISESLRKPDGDFLSKVLLPSLSAALCLFPPSIPILSERLALFLLPKLAEVLKAINEASSYQSSLSNGIFSRPREGKWLIRATGSSGSTSDAEEYVVDLTLSNANKNDFGFHATGVGTTGKSKNGVVTIFGNIRGSLIHFVEEWADTHDEGFGTSPIDDAASSCVVTARLGLDGMKFEGTYRNVQFGSSGQIAGLFCDGNDPAKVQLFRVKDSQQPRKEMPNIPMTELSASGALLGLAHSHLADIIGVDPPSFCSDHFLDHVSANERDKESMTDDRIIRLRRLLSLKTLSRASIKSTSEDMSGLTDNLEKRFFHAGLLRESDNESFSFQNTISSISRIQEEAFLSFSEDTARQVDEIDVKLNMRCAGQGSLSPLCPSEYNEARRLLFLVLLHHCGMTANIDSIEDASDVWIWASKLMEDGVRTAISSDEQMSKREKAKNQCRLICDISNFLLSLATPTVPYIPVECVGRDLSEVYQELSCMTDIHLLEKEMVAASERALLRLFSIRERIKILEQDFQNFGLVESFVVGLPKLLSRNGRHRETTGTLGSHYLTGLYGTSIALRKSLRGNVQQLVNVLVKLANDGVRRRKENPHTESSVMVDSMSMALIASMTMVLQDEDLIGDFFVEPVLKLIPTLLEAHRNSVFVKIEESQSSVGGKEAIVESLNYFAMNEISRGILKATTALAHVMFFQVWNASKTDVEWSPAADLHCLNILMDELVAVDKLFIAFLEESEVAWRKKQSQVQWERFLDQAVGVDKSDSKVKSPTRQVGLSGIQFLWDNGSQLVMPFNSPQKLSSNHKGKQSSTDWVYVENPVATQGSFGHHYYSHWIHILAAATNAKNTAKILATNSQWISLLLSAVGMDANLKIDERPKLPGRYRCRFLRMLFPVLELMDPSSELVKGLFDLAGSTCTICTSSFDEDESLVSREAVSLLRRLHSPSRTLWRGCVNNVIQSCLENGVDDVDGRSRKLGVFCFFNGAFDSLKKGSYVLLKPAAAVPLSAEHQALLSSSKNHSSGGSSGTSGSYPLPHHIVGNGTEGIVAGLCRSQAPAGIVSNIDLKSGCCEVILLSRDQLSTHPNLKHSNFSNESRKSLTVRALQSPLVDVVQAQEIPIFVDGSVVGKKLLSGVLKDSIATLEVAKFDSDKKDQDRNGTLSTLKSSMVTLTTALMALRASITLLSDETLALAFLDENDKTATGLEEVLHVAIPDDLHSNELDGVLTSPYNLFMSSFPAHEARLVHLVSLFRRLGFEESLLDNTPGFVLKSRIADLVKTYSETERVLSPNDSDKFMDPKTSASSGEDSIAARTVSEDRRSASTTGASASGNHAASQSTAGSDNSDDDNEESEAAATAAAHLREAAIAQMAELGLPRSWCELALRRVGGTNIEAAVHFCLERGGEMERLLAEERERERESSEMDPNRRRANRSESSHLLRQLMEMGFPSRWCAEALAATGNNVDEALTWILTNGERLSAEDEGMEDAEDDDDDDDDDEEVDGDNDDESDATDDQPMPGLYEAEGGTKQNIPMNDRKDENDGIGPSWKGSVVPLRFISGRSVIDASDLSISGLPSGGFSSVGTKGVMLTSGKWYYEAILETAGCLQIGWADGSFAGHCHAERGDGCGDGPSSWSFDGWRRYRWHSVATEWGCRWAEGDVVGCLVDMDDKVVSFTLNGRGEEIGMGVAFSGHGFRPCSGVYACVSFNRKERLKLILGGPCSAPFKYQPPPGYKGVGEAVMNAVNERDLLIARESVLDKDTPTNPSMEKSFLCDFSDGEHGHELMAWAHRYYGSDASVHLGSGRLKQPVSKTSPTDVASTTTQCLMRRIDKVWSQCHINVDELGRALSVENEESAGIDECRVLTDMRGGLSRCGSDILKQYVSETRALASLAARKLLLHLIIATGSMFDPSCIFGSKDTEHGNALRFWKMIELSASLRSAGWVGEAGAMALAAEALGLGISSNENAISRLSNGSSDRSGLVSIADLDEGMILPSGGILQLLSTVVDWSLDDPTMMSTGRSLVACSEAAIGSDGGGGVLTFLQRGLQSAVCKSEKFRRVVVASIRRSVRLLAVVEYDSDDTTAVESADIDDDMERAIASREKKGKDELQFPMQPDARLASFLTGLLLSTPIVSAVQNPQEIYEDLFQAWSVGLLSASLPWRMICAFTAAGILNQCPSAVVPVVNSFPTIASYYARLRSTVARRTWAERAAMPICSRYSQAMVELLCSVARAVKAVELPRTFLSTWDNPSVDAATPLPFPVSSCKSDWEATDGWISTDRDWEMWTGTVERKAVNWKTPSRSAVRALMEGGDGPPMLREGCTVMRGLDWDDLKYGNADGKDEYDEEKAKRQEESKNNDRPKKESDSSEPVADEDNPAEGEDDVENPDNTETVTHSKPKKKKLPSPKLPIGVVLSVEPWNGVPGMGRRVKWKLTGKEGVYRYGGDGGNFDLSHVEVNKKGTRVRKRHPLPESAEQCAARHGFGRAKRDSILLRLCTHEDKRIDGDGNEIVCREGILEWPEFGAGMHVEYVFHNDGSVVLKEKDLLFGSKDAGWEARFGQPSYVPGTEVRLRPEKVHNQANTDTKHPSKSLFEVLAGSVSFSVKTLRRKEDGGELTVFSDYRIQKCTRSSDSRVQAPMPPPFCFDRDFHSSSLALSRDGKTVSCVSSDGRGTAFANIGFSKGVHYWEVKLEQADIGSVFIGVAEKPSGSGSSHAQDSPPRLNRWHGWGFVNFRATYTSGAERIYGAHCHAGDTIGVLLDCDAGRISFFFDGLKYGEHIINDLGCAFENLSPFGFNCDGCGSGGAGEGAPSGVEGSRSGRYLAQGSVRPKALWPVVGLRNQGDSVTISSKWNSSYGVDGVSTIRNLESLAELCNTFSAQQQNPVLLQRDGTLPHWFVAESFSEYQRWTSGSWKRAVTRGSGPYRLAGFGLDMDLDTSPIACASASALLGLRRALLPGDRVRLKRSAGRILELAEEAVVLGAYQGRLYYQIVAQKSEGGSLTEGGGRVWCWDESEVVDGLDIVSKTPKELGIELPLMQRFKCPSKGGLKIVYENGAIIRSDIEIFETSSNLGIIPKDTIIPEHDVLERRVNSSGVVRFRVRYETTEGWISSRIRGGKEEPILEPVDTPHDNGDSSASEEKRFFSPGDCADEWFKRYIKEFVADEKISFNTQIRTMESFKDHAKKGIIEGLSVVESDTFLAQVICKVSAFSFGGNPLDAPFEEVASALAFGIATYNGEPIGDSTKNSSLQANQAAAAAFESIRGRKIPSLEALLARASVLRAFNRRARIGLPWMAIRPCQENSAILGGVYGHGASVDRAGRHSNASLISKWVEVPSLARSIRDVRGLFFTTVKKEVIWSVTEATTTPTPLSHDEYELPREIRTVRINRLRARRVMSCDDTAGKRKYSVFAQLQNETKSWGGAALRRGFVAKGHGGQKRAFKVKLIGEGVNDYSGPYREIFTDAVAEVLRCDESGKGSLGVLDATPNNVAGVGDNRDLFMFSLNGNDIRKIRKVEEATTSTEREIQLSFSTLIAARDESFRETEEGLVFLGRLTGTAFRHGIALDLPLPLRSVWNAIVEESRKDDSIEELDLLAHRHGNEFEAWKDLLWWQRKMLNSFVSGISSILPVELFPILKGEELRDLVCGNSEIDVDMLKKVVEYEGYDDGDEVIGYFWETLREFTHEERKLFLQFVWARNRLPLKESDFDAPFKIQKDCASDSEQSLPSASTCFFSLTLPNYKSKKQLQEKLLFAIKNVTTMETDFQTNSAEISEGYRAF